MEIAYIISAYKYPEQLIRLVERLNTDSTSFFVHVDKKTDDLIFRQMVNGLIHLSNVHFLRRYTCHWGGFGHVAATLEGINELFKSETDFDYAILLTAQDYPIKSNLFIDAFLEEHKGKLFVEFFALPHDEWQNCGMDRIEAWHWHVFNRHFSFPSSCCSPIKRNFPKGFKPFGGSSYWCLSRECIEYIHELTRQNRAFVNFFKHVDVPDEIFFQTIILNSPFAVQAVNDNLRYIDWKDLSSGSPAILCKNDLVNIAVSPKLFARKFDMTIDAGVLGMIDEMVLAHI
jgi:Core-2/I-Branching enzyme